MPTATVSACAKISPIFSPTRSIIAWKSSFRGQPCLDAVDDRQFGIALFGLFEQALGLVEETRVFEGDAHGVGERLQETDI